ncbi:MAG: DNA repair protein RadA [Deltaproteobacteria bacterium]|nr:DNA repair protein RadA [Deltaproteobacteria bacterium]
MSGKAEKTVFVCQSCGSQSPKWLGRCPDCSNWNSLVEETRSYARPGLGPWDDGSLGAEAPQPLREISTQAEQRFTTGVLELDRVLGGGVVPGSAVLIGGDPGIGKSTLLLQTLHALSQDGALALYISGEESARQIKMRGERLGVGDSRVQILAETALENIFKTLKTLKPRFLAIDSIQTIFSGDLSSAPGSVSQVRETAGRLILWAKKTVTSLFLVGHVTKEGLLAGPRVLEHMVDTVLYFEGERGHSYRILRAVKNRFGSTNEIGVFEMKDAGLAEIQDPSSLFLAERPCDVSGSVVVPSLEGTRPILVELQALVSPSNFGVPRRTSMGVDANRVSLLLAVLEKKAGLPISGQDIFVNVAGGVRLEEPAVDLGIAAALASSFLDRPIPSNTIIFGEVGLTGEVRGVSQADIRVKEAGKLGFTRCLLPRNNLEKLPVKPTLELIGISSLQDCLGILF